jgi:hypothetical protein
VKGHGQIGPGVERTQDFTGKNTKQNTHLQTHTHHAYHAALTGVSTAVMMMMIEVTELRYSINNTLSLSHEA